jgi:hypothetical protein
LECRLPGSTGALRDFIATLFFSFSTVSTHSGNCQLRLDWPENVTAVPAFG